MASTKYRIQLSEILLRKLLNLYDKFFEWITYFNEYKVYLKNNFSEYSYFYFQILSNFNCNLLIHYASNFILRFNNIKINFSSHTINVGIKQKQLKI